MIYDVKTNNRTFLEMAVKLKEKGVNNNKFMLILYDDSLSGVNVYDGDLSPETKAKIYQECCRNFWYFLREVVKVAQEGSSDGVLFGLHYGNLAISYANVNNCNSIVVLPRQQGKTIAEVAFSLWVHLFAGTYINETYLHKNLMGSKDNLSRFKKMKELLPKWLMAIVCDNNDKDNLEEKYFNKRKNRIQALAAASSDAAADKLGRGSSTALVYYDEFAFLERNQIVMNAMVPAWTTSSRVAKANNAPYGIRITTTPNNLSLPQASYCYDKFVKLACKFTFNIYDIPLDELEQYIYNNSGNNYLYIYYSWQELGLSYEWYEGQLRSMGGDALNAQRELDCVWPEASEGNVFDVTELAKIKHFVKPVCFVLNVNNYGINFYEKIDFTRNYILSCDCSGGLSLDRSVISIIDPEDFRIVGLYANSRIDTDSFRKLIYDLATKYLVHSVINVENNSMGVAILDTLMKDPIIEPRLYKEYVDRQAEKTMNDGRIVKQKTKRLVYGTNTNTKSRELMYQLLPAIVDDEPYVFVSEDFYDEIRNLIRNPRGKVEARSGKHDDIVMSYLIFRYSLNYGRCFQERFHINSIPSKANVRNSDLSYSQDRQFLEILDTANTMDNDTDSYNEQEYLNMKQIEADMIYKDKHGYSSGSNSSSLNDMFAMLNSFDND